MRISVIGLPGSGKSTVAQMISQKLSVPYIHIDRFWFEAGGRQGSHDTPNIEQVRAHIREKTMAAISNPSWVSDGFYSRIQPEIASKADVVIYLDIALWRRLLNHAARMLRPASRHEEINTWDDLKFFVEIVRRNFKNQPKLLKFVETYKDKVVQLQSRKEIKEYLDRLRPNSSQVTEPRVLVQGNFTPDDLIVSVQPSNRQIDPLVEAKIEDIWTERLQYARGKGKTIYNGLSYRLNSLEQKDGKLYLNLAEIEYKVRDGLIAIPEYFKLPEPFWRKGCFTAATVKTTDNQYLMVELSGKSMNTNVIDLVGGIVETSPEIRSGEGIFESFYAELREEILIPKDEVDSIHLTAIYQEDRGNIGLYFQVKLRLSSNELKQRYATSEMEHDIKEVKFFSHSEYLETLKNHNPNKQLVATIVSI